MNPTTQQAQPNFGNYSDWAQQNMQNGVSAQTLQSTLQQQGINPTAQQTAPTGKQPSWWEKLLPTAGGTVGSILGSLLPIPGLDIAAGAAGGAAGGALGKELENKLTGQSGGIGSSALENAIGGGVGTGIGDLGAKVIGDIGSKVAGNFADKAIAGQASKGLVDQETANLMRTVHGVTNLDNGAQLASIYTGSADSAPGKALLNKAVEGGIAKNGPQGVDLSGLNMPPFGTKNYELAQAVAKSGNNELEQTITGAGLNPKDANAIRQNLWSSYNGMSKDIGGAVSPTDALTFQRKAANLADQEFSKYIASGRTDSTALAKAGVYDNVSKSTIDGLFSPNGQDVVIPQEEKAALIKDIQQYAGPKNQQSAQAVADQVKQAQTYSDLRKIQAPWVKVSQAVQKTADNAAKSYGLTASEMGRSLLPMVGGIAGGGGKGAIAGTLAGIGAKAPLEKGGATMLSSLSDALGNKGVQQVMKILPQIGSIGLANLPNDVNNSQNANMSIGANPMQQGLQSPMGGINPTGNANYSNVLNTMMALGVLDPQSYGSMAASVLGQAVPTMQKTAIEQGLLSGLPGLFGNAGGAQGIGGSGILAALLSHIPGTAQNTAQSASNQLGSMLGMGGFTPNFLQTPNTQGAQMGTYQGILSGLGG